MLSRRGVLSVLGSLWIAGIGFGVWEAYIYQTTPGPQSAVPAQWPSESRLARTERGPTLVMFVHPECPCSRASLEELREIVRRTKVAPTIVCLGPGACDAAGVPGATSIADPDGREARRFGAATSGHVVVYTADGELAFAGGITGSRGHAGDNNGRRAAIEALTGTSGVPDHPVFGCGLFAEDDQT